MESYIQQSEEVGLIKHGSLQIWHFLLINIYRINLFIKISFPILFTNVIVVIKLAVLNKSSLILKIVLQNTQTLELT
jgi:hypothetical protein